MEMIFNLELEQFIEYLHSVKGYDIELAKEIAKLYY